MRDGLGHLRAEWLVSAGTHQFVQMRQEGFQPEALKSKPLQGATWPRLQGVNRSCRCTFTPGKQCLHPAGPPGESGGPTRFRNIDFPGAQQTREVEGRAANYRSSVGDGNKQSGPGARNDSTGRKAERQGDNGEGWGFRELETTTLFRQGTASQPQGLLPCETMRLPIFIKMLGCGFFF